MSQKTVAPTTEQASARPAAGRSPAPAPDTARPATEFAPALAFSAVVGPVLVVASSLLWTAGLDEARFALQFLGAALTAVGLVAVCLQLAEQAPRAANVLGLLALVGFGAGGVGFAVDGLHEIVHGSTSMAETDGLAALVAPTATGALGPLCVVAIGVAVLRFRPLPVTSGVLLVVGGVLFPLSRVGEVPPLAVVVDLLLAAAIVPVGVRLWRSGRPEA